jgi:hypothetical protein
MKYDRAEAETCKLSACYKGGGAWGNFDSGGSDLGPVGG